MSNFIVLLGDQIDQTISAFESIPGMFDQSYYTRKHQKYDAWIHLAICFDEQFSYAKSFIELRKEIDIQKILIIFFYPSSKSFDKIDQTILNQTKDKNNLILLYDNNTEYNVKQYLKKNKSQIKSSHVNDINEVIEDLMCEKQSAYNDQKMAILLGGPGVGKTTLFLKLTGQSKSSELPFDCFYFEEGSYQLVDGVSLNLDVNSPDRDKNIRVYQNFFQRTSKVISTFFFLVKFERLDIMKQNFLQISGYFRQFIKKFVIIVGNWDDSYENEDQSQLKESIESFFIKSCKVKSVIFLLNSVEQSILKSQIQSQIIEEKGVNFENTIFQLVEDQAVNDMMDQQVKKLEEQKFQQQASERLQLKQYLLQKKQQLIYERSNLDKQHQERIKQIAKEFELKKQENQLNITTVESQLRELEIQNNPPKRSANQSYKNGK